VIVAVRSTAQWQLRISSAAAWFDVFDNAAKIDSRGSKLLNQLSYFLVDRLNSIAIMSFGEWFFSDFSGICPAWGIF